MDDQDDRGYSRAPELEDLLSLCKALNAEGVRYVLIGGFAVILHGFVRATKDIDLLVDASIENIQRLKRAMAVLPDNAISLIADDEVDKYNVVRIADEIVVDLLKTACGVDYARAADGGIEIKMPRQTTATGDFDLLLPDGTQTVDVFVIAPGFSFRAFRPPVKTDQQLMILMRQNGGGLDLITPMWDDSSARVPYLVHNGTALPLMFLPSWRLASVGKIDGSTLRTVAPLFEPGGYGLCLATQAEIASAAFQAKHCSFGNLAPFGSLALSVKDPDAIAGTP